MPSSIFTTITSMAMMASSTSSPSARISAPRVMRSKKRPVSSMMRKTTASVSGTAAATTMPTRQPRLSRLTSSTTPSAMTNLSMNSSMESVMFTAWSGHLGQADAERQCAGDLRGFRLQRLAEVEAVPAVLHHRRQHQCRLALVADDEGRRVLIAAPDIGDVGELQGAAAGDDGRVRDLLQVVIGAVEADEDLRPVGVDRAGGRHGVLPLQGGEDVLRGDAERDQLGVGELDEDALRPLAEDIDLLDAGHMQKLLADRLGLPDQRTHRHAVRLQRVEREADIGIFVVDERAHGPGGEVAAPRPPSFLRAW